MTMVTTLVGLIAIALADLRWLRVAQREHYLAGSVSRFVSRWWWQSGRANRALTVVGLLAFAASFILPNAAALTAIVVATGPVGLGIFGRTSKLAWTRRLKTLAVATGVVQLLALGVAALIDIDAAPVVAALLAVLSPTVIDVVTGGLAPWERRQAEPFVTSARQRLQSVGPTVVAITGSYGKTTTKNFVAHLLSGSCSVFATPASFNNRAGLSRAINEQLAPGTDVFVAEMGTYGPGEIADLCSLCPPKIAVLTSIGPVHLERFGSEAAIVHAKSEIFVAASVCVLNVDDERLDALTDGLIEQGKQVWRCSSFDDQADVCVRLENDGFVTVFMHGEQWAEGVALEAPPGNVACALAVALSLEVDPRTAISRLADLPVVPHRQEVVRREDGPVVIDDTYNANPASVRRALELLTKASTNEGKRVVATPGMVELGRRQPVENYSFAREAGDTATDIIVIGRTNRRALLDGAHDAGVNVITVDHLDDAVAWVKQHTSTGDAVLYVNDLPDHFP